MKPRVERIWPPKILGLTGLGLARGWPALLAAFVAMAAISIARTYLPPVGPQTAGGMGGFLLYSVTDIITDALIASALVAWLIRRLEPAAMDGAVFGQRILWGWGASALTSLLIRGPAMISAATFSATSPPGFNPMVYLAAGILTLLAQIFLGYALGEAVTRRLNPLQALAASIAVTRGNRFALLVLTLVVQVLFALANYGVATASADLDKPLRMQVILVGQGALSALSIVLGTAVYLELRRVQLGARPEAVSDTFA